MHANGIDLIGWQLNNPDLENFDLEMVEIFGECRSCEDLGVCAMPCESVRRLVPKDGRIVSLGWQKDGSGPRMSYFAHVTGDELRFLLLSSPDHRWATAKYITHEQVPPWAIEELNRDNRVIS